MSKELNEKLDGIDAVLDNLVKGKDSEVIEDEEIEKSEEEIEEEEEIEKSEEDLEDEEIEKSEDETLMNLEEVVSAVTEKVREEFAGEIESLKSSMKKIVETIQKQTGVMEKMDSDNEEDSDSIAKSLAGINEKLNKISKMKKSVTETKELNIFDRYKKDEKDINSLTKGQRATILADAFEAGNKNVSVIDITNAEMGHPISEAAIRVIKSAIK